MNCDSEGKPQVATRQVHAGEVFALQQLFNRTAQHSLQLTRLCNQRPQQAVSRSFWLDQVWS